MNSPGGERCGKCGHSLARPTNFCPFCGSSQLVSSAFPAENESTVSANEEIRPSSQDEEITPTSVPDIVKEPAPDLPQPEIKSVQPPALPQPTKLVGQRPSGRTVVIVIASVVALILLLVLIGGRGNSVTVAAAPDHWTAVDLSRFPAGTRVVLFARGAFRVRSLSTAPVLVDGEGGDVELSDLPRDGLEIRSANGSPLDVKISSVKS